MNDSKYQKLREFVVTEDFDLVEANKKFPVFYQDVIEEVVDAWKAKSVADLESTFLEEATAIRVRESFEQSGEKFTEAKIKAKVETDEELMKARFSAVEADYEFRKWNNLRLSFEAKERTIKNTGSWSQSSFGAYD